MLRPISLCQHAVAITPVGPQAGSSFPVCLRRRPSPCQRRVGSHLKCFEACSAFTRVTACWLAGSPKAALSIRCFDSIVASTADPIATGWNDSCRVGVAPTEDRHLCTAHTDTGPTFLRLLICKSAHAPVQEGNRHFAIGTAFISWPLSPSFSRRPLPCPLSIAANS